MNGAFHNDLVRRACDLLGKNGLADHVGVSRATVDAWLAGTSGPPPRMLKEIRRLLEQPETSARVRL
jgi:hypothetical protein